MQIIAHLNHEELIEKKSRFICYLFRVTTEADVNNYLQQIKKEHYKARHHCYAYIINQNQMKASDDGEPTGTAGIPILETLQQNHLEQTLAIVVRYFGGIKLGTGGLNRAYRQATANAIKETGMVEVVEKQVVKITISYALNDEFQYFCQTHQLTITDIAYDTAVHLTLTINQVSKLTTLLDQYFYNQYQLTKLGFQTVEIPI